MIARVLLAAVALLLAVAAQASPLNSLLPVRLDPLLVLAVSVAVVSGPRGGAVMGLAAGGISDMVIGGGLSMILPKLLVAALAGGLKPLLFYRQAMVILPLIALATVLQEVLVALGMALHGRGLMLHHLAMILAPEALGNMLLAWPIYVGVRWALKRSETRYPRSEEFV